MKIELTIPETSLLKAILKDEIRKNNESAERDLELGFDHREWVERDNKHLESMLKKLNG